MTLLDDIMASLGLGGDADETEVHFLGRVESACLQELHGEPVLVLDADDEAAVCDLDEPTADELQLTLGEFEIDYVREDELDAEKRPQSGGEAI